MDIGNVKRVVYEKHRPPRIYYELQKPFFTVPTIFRTIGLKTRNSFSKYFYP